MHVEVSFPYFPPLLPFSPSQPPSLPPSNHPVLSLTPRWRWKPGAHQPHPRAVKHAVVSCPPLLIPPVKGWAPSSHEHRDLDALITRLSGERRIRRVNGTKIKIKRERL